MQLKAQAKCLVRGLWITQGCPLVSAPSPIRFRSVFGTDIVPNQLVVAAQCPRDPGINNARRPVHARWALKRSNASSRFAGIELNHREAVLHLLYEGTSIKEHYDAAADLLRRSVEITPRAEALFINLAREKGSVWELKTPKQPRPNCFKAEEAKPTKPVRKTQPAVYAHKKAPRSEGLRVATLTGFEPVLLP